MTACFKLPLAPLPLKQDGLSRACTPASNLPCVLSGHLSTSLTSPVASLQEVVQLRGDDMKVEESRGVEGSREMKQVAGIVFA